MLYLSKSTSPNEIVAGEFKNAKQPRIKTFLIGALTTGWPTEIGSRIRRQAGELQKVQGLFKNQLAHHIMSFGHWISKQFDRSRQELEVALTANRALEAELNREIEARDNKLRELKDLNKELTLGFLQRTHESVVARERFELALGDSGISVFHHDTQHNCIWSHNCILDQNSILGKRDDEVMSKPAADILMELKKHALIVPKQHEGEICINTDSGEMWCLVKVIARKDFHGKIIGTTSISMDITERKRWESHLLMLMREVNHRSRNLLAVLSSISSSTAATATSIQDYSNKFGKRLQSLAKAHEIVARDQWDASSLRSLIDVQLGAHQYIGIDRIRTKGPELVLKPKAMQNLALALHELLTNSAKYGALSVSGGCVDLRWRVTSRKEGNVLRMIWREMEGPAVSVPKSKGFGSMLLERVVGAELDGKSIIKYRRSGVVWQTEIGNAHFFCPGETQSNSSDTFFVREACLRRRYDQLLAAK